MTLDFDSALDSEPTLVLDLTLVSNSALVSGSTLSSDLILVLDPTRLRSHSDLRLYSGLGQLVLDSNLDSSHTGLGLDLDLRHGLDLTHNKLLTGVWLSETVG